MVIEVQHGANKGFNFKTHPNINRNLYQQQNLLALRDPDRPFPVGSQVGVLKWHMKVELLCCKKASSSQHDMGNTYKSILPLITSASLQNEFLR